MRKYFIHNGQSEIGPFDFEQLREMQIKKDTPVWYDGIQDWTKANNLEELKTIITSNTLPPKFQNFTQQDINSPIFSKPIYEKNQDIAPVKKKKLWNIFIGIGILVFVFIVLMLFTISKSDDNYNQNGEFIQSKNITPASNAEKERINLELTEKNRNFRNNFEKYIHVSTNQYKYNELGGISNLDVIVSNDTDYLLNEVNVNIDYIKDSGEIFKSENIILNNIPAHQNKSASAPESNRGTSVKTRMDAITSKKMHFCFFATNGIGTYSEPEVLNDPFFCK